jgi:hypothetical protein
MKQKGGKGTSRPRLTVAKVKQVHSIKTLFLCAKRKELHHPRSNSIKKEPNATPSRHKRFALAPTLQKPELYKRH